MSNLANTLAAEGIGLTDSLVDLYISYYTNITYSWNWITSSKTASAGNNYNVKYTGAEFLAIGQGGEIWLSSDGANWTQKTTVPNGAYSPDVEIVRDICAAADVYGRYYYSTDRASSWSPMTVPPGFTNTGTGVALSPEGLCVMIQGTSAAVSTNFTSWTVTALPAGAGSLIYYKDGFYGSSYGSSNLLYSPNGVDWSYVSTTLTTNLNHLILNGTTIYSAPYGTGYALLGPSNITTFNVNDKPMGYTGTWYTYNLVTSGKYTIHGSDTSKFSITKDNVVFNEIPGWYSNGPLSIQPYSTASNGKRVVCARGDNSFAYCDGPTISGTINIK